MHIGKQYPYALYWRMYNADCPWPYLLGKFYRIRSTAFHFLNPVPIWDITAECELEDTTNVTGPAELSSGLQTYPGHTIEFRWRSTLALLNTQIYGELSIDVDGSPAVDTFQIPRAGFDGRGWSHLWTINSQIHFPGHNPGDSVFLGLTVRNWGDLPRPYPR